MSRIEANILAAFKESEWQLEPFIGITEICRGCWLKLRLDGTYNLSGNKTAIRIAKRMGSQGKILCEEEEFSLRIAPLTAQGFDAARAFWRELYKYRVEEATPILNRIRAENGSPRKPIEPYSDDAIILERNVKRARESLKIRTKREAWLNKIGVKQ